MQESQTPSVCRTARKRLTCLAVLVAVTGGGLLVVRHYLNSPDHKVAVLLQEVRSSPNTSVLIKLFGWSGLIKPPARRNSSDVAKDLAAIGPDAVEPLIDYLSDPDTEVVSAAMGALRKIGDHRAVMPIVGALKDKRAEVRNEAGISFRVWGLNDRRPVGPLIAALEDANPQVAANAAVSLGRIGDARAIGPLVKKASLEDGCLAAAAAVDGLKEFLDWPEAIDAVCGAIGSDITEVRRRAAQLEPQRSVPRLIDALAAALSDKDLEVRTEAARSLSRSYYDRSLAARWLSRSYYDCSRATPSLLPALAGPNGVVRSLAASALGSCCEERVVDALIKALSDPDAQCAAAKSLGRIRDERAVGPLGILLGQGGTKLSCAATDSLGEIGGPEAVKALVGALADRRAEVRRAAAMALGENGVPEAVAPLIALLGDKEDETASRAADLLGRIGDANALAPLAKTARGGSEKVAVEAVRAISRIGGSEVMGILAEVLRDETLQTEVRRVSLEEIERIGGERAAAILKESLTARSPEIRFEALWLLCYKKDSDALALSERRLQDPDPNDRMGATLLLGITPRDRSTRLLLPYLRDRSAEMRSCAVRALANIGDKAAVDGLVAAMTDTDESVRQEAVQALGNIRDPRAVKYLAPMLDANYQLPPPPAWQEPSGPRWVSQADQDSAADALGRIGGPEAVDALLTALASRDRRVRHSVALALGNAGDPRAVEPLCRELADKAATSRDDAAFALGDIGDVRAAPALVATLGEDDKNLRYCAAMALGLLGDPNFADALVPLLRDTDLDVRFAAARSLAGLGRSEGLSVLASTALGKYGPAAFYATVGLGLLDEPNARQAIKNAAQRARFPAVRLLARRCLETSVTAAVAEMLTHMDQNYLAGGSAEFSLRMLNDPASLAALDAYSRDYGKVNDAADVARRIRRLAACEPRTSIAK